MAQKREVGTLWIGGPLSWMEQLCLKSFVVQGQKITLFSYDKIPNVPAGVIQRDGREIIDTDDFIKYEKKNSFALFADLFRLHMIRKCPGMIWIDTDVFCHRPMDYDDDYVMGFELPGEHRVNNAVLGLPADSEALSQMLEFTSDRFSIAPFLPPKMQREMREAARAGEPVHVSQQPWGVWGPMMVTHYVHALGLQDRVQPLDAFYPITFRERTKFLQTPDVAKGLITKDTTALHLWASNKRQIGRFHAGLPPKGSYLEMLAKDLEIDAKDAPVTSRGKTEFDAALVDALDIKDVASVADLTGTARGLTLALHQKYDCDVVLIGADSTGGFSSGRQAWVDEYADFLSDNGVEEVRIKLVERAEDLKPVDVLVNLNGFGDRHKVKFAKPFLDKCLHSESRMFMDIRKGSGAFPFIKGWGTNVPLSKRKEDGVEVTRVMLTPNPPAPTENDEMWDKIAVGLAGDDGWYRSGPEGHSFLYVPRDKSTLVVTFDNLDITMQKRDDRRPWGYEFIEKQGWSMLGVLAGGWTWYREPWVYEQFDQLKDDGFFQGFERVVFYGASMGGYAACAFSPAAPGCDVVAISPQSTVDKSIVPWETRYKVVWDRDFSGPYGDAAEVSRAAKRVSILYDPFEPLDRAHVGRFQNDNVRRLPAPLLGHRLGSSLSQMGILGPIVTGAVSGSLTDKQFYSILRARKTFPRYQRELFNRAVAKGHVSLAKKMGKHVLGLNPNRAIEKGLRELD